MVQYVEIVVFFFFNDTATTEIYTLSLHDALPIFGGIRGRGADQQQPCHKGPNRPDAHIRPSSREIPRCRCALLDRKSTRLNSSHANISYAVFCLKKKNKRPRRRAHDRGSSGPQPL